MSTAAAGRARVSATPGATKVEDVERKLSLEAARAAVLAVHSAAGLALQFKNGLRLLRAAEGLCRSAVAVLSAQPAPSASDADVEKAAAAPPRRHRRRRRRTGASRGRTQDSNHAQDEGAAMDVENVEREGEVMVLQLADGGVVMGDLSELFEEPTPTTGGAASSASVSASAALASSGGAAASAAAAAAAAAPASEASMVIGGMAFSPELLARMGRLAVRDVRGGLAFSPEELAAGKVLAEKAELKRMRSSSEPA